jgi:hypothetical protein
MTVGEDQSPIPEYEGRAGVETAYAEAERDGVPFFGIERYEDGYAVTYDLLPAGKRLTPTAHEEVRDRLTDELEAIAGSAEFPTEEVSKSVNDSLGNVSLLGSEDGARRVARAVAPIVLEEANWADA